jgi:hypothetical protein
VTSAAETPLRVPDPTSGPDWLGFHDLLGLGLTAETAAAVLGPHSAVTLCEARDRLALFRQEDRP